MSDQIETVIRDCKNPRCGHDRASHYVDEFIDAADGKVTRKRIPMGCLCRGCDCRLYESERPKITTRAGWAGFGDLTLP